MKFILIVIFVINSRLIFAHLCHDPFIPRERIVLVPEKEIVKLEDKTKFRIYIENTFYSILEDVELIVENPAFEIDIEPPVLKKLYPNERSFFSINMRLREGFPEGDYPLKISVKAKSAKLRPTVEEIPTIVTKPPPTLEKSKIKQEKEPDVSLPTELKPEKEERKHEPAKEEEIKQEVDLPTELKPQIQTKKEPPKKEIVPTEEKTVTGKEKIIKIKEKEPFKEEKEEEVGEIIVKVEKIPWWKKPYLYIIPILFILGVFVWRILKK